MNKWNERFMSLAYIFASYSKDPSTKVGAIIAKGNILVSAGYNGFPKEEHDDERLFVREEKYKITRHAERNAIDNTYSNLDECTLYVTHHPCEDCMEYIATNNIKKIVVGESMPEHWNDSCKTASQKAQEYGIEVVYYEQL
jgi:dCMP deaminase